MFMIEVFIYIGIIAASVSGALLGIQKRLDLFGILFLAVITATGGGLIRDVLIGNFPPASFQSPSYFAVSAIAGLVACYYYGGSKWISQIIVVSDAVGLGVFTAVGSHTVINEGYTSAFLIVTMGVITGIFGGILRDILAREIPFVFQKEIYAIASIIGAVVFLMLYPFMNDTLAMYVCLGVTFMIRMISLQLNLHFPVIEREVSK
ncbi:MAG: trimeric intracellular cation channel family protein [Bacilli bacterium]